MGNTDFPLHGDFFTEYFPRAEGLQSVSPASTTEQLIPLMGK
ncbi:MAG: hypothetical protein VB131_05310 [Burkholderia gladioli]